MNTTQSQTRPRTRWSRFLDSVLPAPSPDRLVRIAEVSRNSVSMAEGSLEDIQVTHVVQETPRHNGDSRFTVLVAARDADVAREVLAGL